MRGQKPPPWAYVNAGGGGGGGVWDDVRRFRGEEKSSDGSERGWRRGVGAGAAGGGGHFDPSAAAADYAVCVPGGGAAFGGFHAGGAAAFAGAGGRGFGHAGPHPGFAASGAQGNELEPIIATTPQSSNSEFTFDDDDEEDDEDRVSGPGTHANRAPELPESAGAPSAGGEMRALPAGSGHGGVCGEPIHSAAALAVSSSAGTALQFSNFTQHLRAASRDHSLEHVGGGPHAMLMSGSHDGDTGDFSEDGRRNGCDDCDECSSMTGDELFLKAGSKFAPADSPKDRLEGPIVFHPGAADRFFFMDDCTAAFNYTAGERFLVETVGLVPSLFVAEAVQDLHRKYLAGAGPSEGDGDAELVARFVTAFEGLGQKFSSRRLRDDENGAKETDLMRSGPLVFRFGQFEECALNAADGSQTRRIINRFAPGLTADYAEVPPLFPPPE